MVRGSRTCVVPLASACVLAVVLAGVPARAAIDMYIGARTVVPNQSVGACSLKAKNALNAVLQGAVEAGETNQWQAYGPPDSSGHSTAGAAIHCYPTDNGYVVTFTCAVETPPNPDSASALCAKLTTAFGS